MPTPVLSADEVAFLKSAFLGLDLGESARRYLGTTDARVARRKHRDILTRAQLRAQRADRGDLAKHLLYAPPMRPPRPPRLRESFDEFVARRGYAGWRFSEQLEAYEAEVPLPATRPTIAAAAASLARLRVGPTPRAPSGLWLNVALLRIDVPSLVWCTTRKRN